MAPIIPDPKKIKPFKNQAAFAAWLAKNHARETEIWIKVYKKDSGVPSVTCPEALDVALCWGWIDAIRKSLDAESFLQRYTPRSKKSMWSQVNRDNIARLTKAGLMQPPGPGAGGRRQGRRPVGCRLRADSQRVEGHRFRPTCAPPSRPTRGRARRSTRWAR